MKSTIAVVFLSASLGLMAQMPGPASDPVAGAAPSSVANPAPTPVAGPAFPSLQCLQSQPYIATSKIVEIRGEKGVPQPNEWTVVLSDTSARGGIRELTIANGQITAERTPLRNTSGTAVLHAIDPAKLKFDSDAVFGVVLREAGQRRVAFDAIDYKLQADPETQVPVWSVNVSDPDGAPIASMQISAIDGWVVTPLTIDPRLLHQRKPSASTESPENAVPVSGVVGAIGNSTVTAAANAKDTVLKAIGTVEETLIGRRTIGLKDDQPKDE